MAPAREVGINTGSVANVVENDEAAGHLRG